MREAALEVRDECLLQQQRRGGAKAGTIVTTGSWTGMVFTKRGAHIAADFGPLGRVEIAFPAEE